MNHQHLLQSHLSNSHCEQEAEACAKLSTGFLRERFFVRHETNLLFKSKSRHSPQSDRANEAKSSDRKKGQKALKPKTTKSRPQTHRKPPQRTATHRDCKQPFVIYTFRLNTLEPNTPRNLGMHQYASSRVATLTVPSNVHRPLTRHKHMSVWRLGSPTGGSTQHNLTREVVVKPKIHNMGVDQ